MEQGTHQQRFRHRPVALLVLGAGLLLVLLANHGLYLYTKQAHQQQFELHVKDVIDAIGARMRRHEQILLGGAGFFDASKEVSRDAWRTYVARLQLEQNYPGIQGVGFSQLIQPGQLAAHTASVRAEGFPAYSVRPPGARDLYTSIVYLEPFRDRNLGAFGFDMFSEATRARAMRDAGENGVASITGKVKLVQETHGKPQAGFLMYVPVYRQNLPLETAPERWRALQGFVYSPYRVNDLMQGLRREGAKTLHFRIFDGVEINEETQMYDSQNDESQASPIEPHSPQFMAMRTIENYGRPWTVQLESLPALEAGWMAQQNLVLLVSGAGFSVLLYFFVMFLNSRREQAEAMAANMTQEIRSKAESLRRSQQLLDSIVEHIPIEVFVKRASDLRYELLNHAWESIHGRSRQELLGKIDHDYFPKEQADRFVEEDRKVLQSTEIKEIPEVRVLTAGGQERILRTLKIGLRNDADQPTHLLGISIDITGQRATQQALQDSAQQTQAILDNVVDGIVTINEKGFLRSFNKSAERIFGYAAQDVIGRNVNMLMPEPYHSAHDGYLEVYRQTSEAHVIGKVREVQGRRQDGTVFPMELAVSRISRHGKSLFIGLVRDITERMRVEQAQAYFSAIVASSTDAIMSKTLDGIVTSWNPAAERMFGYTGAEMLGQPIATLFPPERLGEEPQILAKIRRGESVEHLESIRKRKNGELFSVSVNISPIFDASGSIIGASKIVRDITEEKRLDQMKAEFVSTVSHELRTPLTSIGGALGLVCGGALGPLSEQAKSMLDIAYKNSQRLTSLINDLLDMEKIVAGKMNFDLQVQDIMPLIEQSLESTQAYAQQYQVKLVLKERADGVRVRVDAGRLQQVLSNFLSNAAKFSPPGGQVEVSVRAHAGAVQVEVRDHGPGIPEDFKERIFQKFSQADSSDTRQKGGTGLGLAISKELIERMNGLVGFESQPGQGTSFHLQLPIFADRVLAPRVLDQHRPGAACVLVVEDDPDIAKLMVMMLARAGFSADVAATGEAALQMLGLRQYAVMTLDMLLPDQSGVSLMRQLRGHEEFSKLPIIVVSAFVNDGKLAIQGDFPAVDWIEKPIDENRLIAAVRRGLPALSQGKPRILYVEDDGDLQNIVALLGRDIAEFDAARSLAQARQQLARMRYDLVILDIGLPDGCGWDLMDEIKALQPAPQVIVLSGDELGPELQREVQQALVKSRASPDDLLVTIKQAITKSIVTQEEPKS